MEKITNSLESYLGRIREGNANVHMGTPVLEMYGLGKPAEKQLNDGNTYAQPRPKTISAQNIDSELKLPNFAGSNGNYSSSTIKSTDLKKKHYSAGKQDDNRSSLTERSPFGSSFSGRVSVDTVPNRADKRKLSAKEDDIDLLGMLFSDVRDRRMPGNGYSRTELDLLGAENEVGKAHANLSEYPGRYFDALTNISSSNTGSNNADNFVGKDIVSENVIKLAYAKTPSYKKSYGCIRKGDKEKYGENSAKYNLLLQLEDACANSTSKDDIAKWNKAATMIRGHHANVNYDGIKSVLLLNNEGGAYEKGHNAVLLVDDKGNGAFFSFYPEGGNFAYANGQMRMRLMTPGQVNTLKTQGNIWDATAIGKASATSQSETYSRYIEIPVTTNQGREMLRGGMKYFIDPGWYGIAGVKQCDNMASSIMSCGGMKYYVCPTPNSSFTNVSKDWKYSIVKIGG